MRITVINVLTFFVALAVCAQKAESQQQPAPPSKFKVTSVFADEDWIPLQYTCGVADGSSPRLQWSDPPQGTVSFALIFHDTDAAPEKNAMDVTHWIVWSIPGTATHILAGVEPDSSPDGIQQGKNVRGINGYQPPCPPAGARPHHYVFELFALDTKLSLAAGSIRADLLNAMDGHVIGKAALVGVFGQGIDDKSWRWGAASLPQ